MGDIKDKMKNLMNKVNNQFSQTKFKGQGRVLGSSSDSEQNPRKQQTTTIAKPRDHRQNQLMNAGDDAAFDCPVCGRRFSSESDVSGHIDSCLAKDSDAGADAGDAVSEVEAVVGRFVGSVDVLLKLLGNVAREPGNDKFRRIRMGNPKIREAIGDGSGGVELLEFVGFRLGEMEGEVWATMEEPGEERLAVIREAMEVLERLKGNNSGLPMAAEKAAEMKKIDRQVRVFFSVPESEAAKIDLPDSFYNLSSEEIKREAEQKRKRLEESRLLIPKSYKEKQAIAAKRKYKFTIIRVQFPDGVVLQGVFLPSEPTKALYEFVATALKEPSLEFELLRPAAPKLRVISYFPQSGAKAVTLEEEDLVPSALVKFKPIETDSVAFTGLTNELLEAMEPLSSTAGFLQQ